MSHLAQFYKAPLWLIETLTGGKSFAGNPIIGSQTLNKLGLHVGRVRLAHAMMHVRWFFLKPLMPRAYRDAFHRDGYIAIENFLSTETLAAIKAEIKSLREQAANQKDAAHAALPEARQLSQGDTRTQRILLDAHTQASLPHLFSVSRSKALKNYVGYAGGRWRRPLAYLQRIRNGIKSSGADPQKIIHSDTFHPTVKAWLFLEDVTPAQGPFTYAAGSQAYSKKRLAWEYERSTRPASELDSYSRKGSLRADPEDLATMGMQNAAGLTAKAGTLVIANTNGFHGRGQADDNASRLEMWFYSRHAPFTPWPGIGLSLWTRLEEAVLPPLWRRRDKAAEKKGRKASWHPVPLTDMLDGIE